MATSATRPELSAAVADGQYTIQKALAKGYLINGGTAARRWRRAGDVLGERQLGSATNGIGDPATFTPMFTVAADGSGTHTSTS